ncbi:NUDIX hydrolase domain-like protein [Chytriomyces sp. MP71]|nr:NUDIX hydrolase domain-like protein [Chytriomyces sp. MP71]
MGKSTERLFEECVEAIVSRDAASLGVLVGQDPSVREHANAKKWTLAHFAARFGFGAEAVAVLAPSAAVLALRNSDGRTAAEMAAQWGNDMSPFLVSNPASIPGSSPAEVAKLDSAPISIWEPAAYFGAQSSRFSRRSEIREHPEKLTRLLSNSHAKILPINASERSLVLTASGDALFWLSVPITDTLLSKDTTTTLTDILLKPNPSHSQSLFILLGSDSSPNGDMDAVSYWALDVSFVPSLRSHIESTLHLSFKPSRPAAYTLTAIPYESNLLAQANSILDWHARFRFCPLCGTPTHPINAGYKRQCGSPKDACKSHSSVQSSCFPRTDPVAIVLVVSPDGERVLLGRQKVWPKGMYSCVAGFMEPGETIESAARREVKEETGVVVGERVQYYQSQPWPFPANLMIGMYGQAVVGGEEIRLVDEELEDARWFSREEATAAVGLSPTTLKTAQPYAIAYQLLKNWVDGGFMWYDGKGPSLVESTPVSPSKM